MNRKPWSIIFFSVFLTLIPLFNILLTYYLVPGEFDFSDFIYSLFALPSNRMALFSLTVPSLVSAYAVYSIKNWSLPVFFISMLWILISSLLDLFYYFSVLKSVILMILPLICNILITYYILIPNVRAAYLDSRLRWWETKPRYRVNGKIDISSESLDASPDDSIINNFSEGGVFLSTSADLPIGLIANLKFSILERPLELKGKIVHQVQSINAYGIQFCELSKKDRKSLKDICYELRQNKVPETRLVVDWKEDLKDWYKELIKTGKGIIPEIQNRK